MKNYYKFDTNKEVAEKINILAREQMKLKLLKDLRIDIEICRLEKWDYKQYLLELKEIIDSFVKGVANETNN